ncbi:hypothetical protein L207DRAFT_641851 [Hyaloscypha variabilis F]|uniref:Uncharacterized protein n=1 Tax=Hyaloscypha variabilis (strain UAMH 11265 / GT02V1 / F) TaxID=1149755 RepID=A0A2J6QVL2_HYAVF|nr:hypothetical protein L207DRAFT_641851 [Hyaloscypha variabilis F]
MSSLEAISRDNGAFSIVKAQSHLTLLRMFCAVYDAMSYLTHPTNISSPKKLTEEQMEQYANHYLLVAHWRYRWYLDLIHSVKDTPKETWPVPPWDVAMMMHTHMLNPAAFQKDISSSIRYKDLAGIIDFPLTKLDYMIRHIKEPGQDSGDVSIWYEKDRKHPYVMMEIIGPDTFPPQMKISMHYLPAGFKMIARPPPFSIDLRDAVKRQILFARKITAAYPYDPVPKKLLLDSQQRYAKFMNLIRMNQNPAIVPAVDIDLFWHTHQLTPSNYFPWCKHHVGFPINHDDTIGGIELSTSLDRTTTAWEAAYSEDYLNPSPGPVDNNFPCAHPREPNTHGKTPPPGLTPAQRALWNFDVTHQEMHERQDYLLRQSRTKLGIVNRKLAAKVSAQPDAKTGGKSGGFMKRLVTAAKSELGGERSALLARQTAAAKGIEEKIKDHEVERQAWGRERWPLLVAARGWGDPRVTEGKWVRPPQGTASLDFPIYPATWYDNKELGYYDYIFGGREGSGSIEGGGVTLGGTMCAGRFDGGNCAAVVVKPPRAIGYSGGGCGGCGGGGG